MIIIDILIPTYNRVDDLEKNLVFLNEQLVSDKLTNDFRIIVSNNASTDSTQEMIFELAKKLETKLIVYNQRVNIGLEKNAVFTLEKSTADFVVFLGDDDFFPEGYLKKLHEIAKSKRYGVVIPANAALNEDGTIIPTREKYKSQSVPAGFNGLKTLVFLGHQLSGLFFKREGVVEAYKKIGKNQNIYLFIFFIGFVMKKEPSCYLGEYQVKVTTFNSKDWKYDESGLLTEIFKNFNALYQNERTKKIWLSLKTINEQSWRLRIGKNPLFAIQSFAHLIKSKDVDVFLKLILPFMYGYLYAKLSILYIRKAL